MKTYRFKEGIFYEQGDQLFYRSRKKERRDFVVFVDKEAIIGSKKEMKEKVRLLEEIVKEHLEKKGVS